MGRATEVTVGDTERWSYRSKVTGASYRVTLTLPPRRTEAPIPVLVLLDGETMILTATEFLRTLNATASGIIGPVALIAVMAEATSGLDYVATRFHDFTPVEWTLPGPFADDNALARYGTGGADKLVAAIVDEILPQARAVGRAGARRRSAAGDLRLVLVRALRGPRVALETGCVRRPGGHQSAR